MGGISQGFLCNFNFGILNTMFSNFLPMNSYSQFNPFEPYFAPSFTPYFPSFTPSNAYTSPSYFSNNPFFTPAFTPSFTPSFTPTFTPTPSFTPSFTPTSFTPTSFDICDFSSYNIFSSYPIPAQQPPILNNSSYNSVFDSYVSEIPMCDSLSLSCKSTKTDKADTPEEPEKTKKTEEEKEEIETTDTQTKKESKAKSAENTEKSESKKVTKPSLSSSQKTDKTVKAYGKNGMVDFAVHELKISDTTVYKFGYTNLDSLQPDLLNSIEKLTKLAKEHGYILVISDGYRSIAEQTAAKKRKPGLCATPGKSPHNYGCAIDIALYSEWGGRPVSITNLPWFYEYAKNDLGLDWGQDWSSKKEPWHFERRNWNKSGSDVYLAYCEATGKDPVA